MNHVYEVHDKEPRDPREIGTDAVEHDPANHVMTEPQKPEDAPKEVIFHKGRLAWAHELIHDVEKYGAPYGSLIESKRPRTYSNYVALLYNIIDAKPSSFEEAVENKVKKDVMHEEYQSIMKNDV